MHRNNVPIVSRAHAGFTLLELLLYVSIASSVLLLATMTTISIVDVQMKNVAIAEVEQQGSRALHTVLSTIRNSEDVTFPTAGLASTTATLNVYAVIDDPTRFDVVNGQLRMRRAATAAAMLTTPSVAVTSFVVTNISRPGTPGSARVHVTLRSVNGSGRQLYNYSRTFIGTATLRQP